MYNESDMDWIADKLIELRLATRRACMVENKAKSTLSLKTKMLFLLKDKPLTPAAIMEGLGIVKTNLAAIASDLIKNDLIEKRFKEKDGRLIEYAITTAGSEYLNEIRAAIEARFRGLLESEQDKEQAKIDIDKVITLLSFL